MSKPIHFEMSERKILLRFIDVIVVLCALYLLGIIFQFDYFLINERQWMWSVILAGYLLFFATVFEMYNLQRASRITGTLRSAVSTGSVTSLVYLLTPFFTPVLPENRIQILYFYLAVTLPLLLWRAVYIKLFASSRFNKNIIIIADSSDAALVAQTLQDVDPNYNISGFINTGPAIEQGHIVGVKSIGIKDAHELLHDQSVTEIVVASNEVEGITSNLYKWLIELVENGYSVREYTQVYEEMTDRVPVQYVGKDFYRYFPFARNNQNRLYLVYHRLFDLVASVLGILIGIALVPFVFLGNLIGNRGPLFYTQERVGLNRKLFKIIKFRTMVTDAEKSGAQFAVVNDARITKFGKFLRATRIDEFPQFLNILKGDMSVIGPRPEREIFVEQLSEKIPFYETRHVVKPGLTGWAQVKTKYGVTDEDHLRKLQYDLFYIKKRSVFLDIRIIVKTLSTVIFFKGQ
ncbi:exopolysaccharide biosynthesis polyprenyl glycosylphosphotransferase [Nonlabens xylanidelens]|uniref:Exopolysaccharide biosynthesis polyprenyl glycosylphosphotransferase n=2 Tax=Nonlabens xylanidelens TaxID=191564 RepID=A0A2S6IEU8_9FLAO|nr:exopolysaccharide biosynthesis polyprenyl glycosylphosphotransferase [Nonlabens xylanidelens]